jgi:hypothetical protein
MGPNKHNIVEPLNSRSIREALSELDDQQVITFVQQLIDERETLIKRQEHLVSLSRLSEKTIAAADEIARQIQEEAKNQAESEAEAIILKARESASQMVEECKNAATSAAQKELLAVKSIYQEELNTFSSKTIDEFESRMKEITQEISEAMISCTGSLKNQLSTFQKHFEEKFSGLETLTVSLPEEKPAKPESVNTANNVTEQVNPNIAGREIKIIEILAPRDKDRIELLRAHLDELEDVVQTDVKHLIDRTLIEVTLMKPLDLTRIMSDWPEVEMVQNVTIDGKVRSQVMLGVESELAEEKDMLNHRINRIAHHIKPIEE